MKIEEPRAMREIHKIRMKIWEETKHLSVKEKIRRIRDLADKFIKENHLEDRVVSFKKIYTPK